MVRGPSHLLGVEVEPQPLHGVTKPAAQRGAAGHEGVLHHHVGVQVGVLERAQHLLPPTTVLGEQQAVEKALPRAVPLAVASKRPEPPIPTGKALAISLLMGHGALLRNGLKWTNSSSR